MSEENLQKKAQAETQKVDYVLVHPVKYLNDAEDEKEKEDLIKKEEKRERFEQLLKNDGFQVTKEKLGENMAVKLHCTFKRLCDEAEMVKLQMPLNGCANYPEPSRTFIGRFIEEKFETDNEVDFVSAHFLKDRLNLYEGYEDQDTFFRPSIRSMLVHHILINLDVRTPEEKQEKAELDQQIDSKLQDEESGTSSSCCNCFKSEQKAGKFVIKKNDAVGEKYHIPGQIHSLPYLIMKGVYTDSFILHDESQMKDADELIKDKLVDNKKIDAEDKETFKKHNFELKRDARKDMNETWTVFWKFQPLWRIRNYFGEKIAFYFAWVGVMTTGVWIPMIFGFIVFLYGLYLSIDGNADNFTVPENATASEAIKIEVQALLDVVKLSFDNDATPFFAMCVCLYGTFFQEFWKRKQATLAYEWDVEHFEDTEPDRPQFYGLKIKTDPVTQQRNWFYPIKRQFLKYFVSASTLIVMIVVVVMSVIGVTVYRVIVNLDYCPQAGVNASQCLMVTTVVSSIINAVAIVVLGLIYEKLAYILNKWENHRTETQYEDNLIFKLYAFQFANCYSSCIYIAFIRGRVTIFGYADECPGTTGSCMSQLSFQVMTLMITKPITRVFKSIVLPVFLKLWKLRPNWFCRCDCCPCATCKKRKIADEKQAELLKIPLERERLKIPLGDFCLDEYKEKTIQYGYLMLFAASFPLAPLLVLALNLIDIRIDAKRMLWSNRRPVAEIRQDIGKWYGIVDTVNTLGVVSNGFIIGFTSNWASEYPLSTKLWIVIGFEHIVWLLKFLVAYLVPDVPKEVRLAIRREKFQVNARIYNEENKKRK